MTTWPPVFEVDRDFLGAQSKQITYKALTSTSGSTTQGNRAVLTSPGHGFSVNDRVSVSGVDSELFDGIHIIKEVTTDTFSYDLAGTVTSTTAVSPVGWVTFPAPSYIRYPVTDTVFDDAASYTTLMAEPWDYNTIRIVWGINGPLDKHIKKDISEGLVPRIAVVRSSFGHPVTPLDGEKIIDIPYSLVLPSTTTSKIISYFETQPAKDNILHIPATNAQSLYDRNLTPGTWHYYSLFYFVQGTASEQQWLFGASDEAITPAYHGHGEKLYNMLPEYYRSKDLEFTYGTGRDGVVKRLLNIVGMELDYTKTLADSLEDAYNIDRSNYTLMHLLGETNFGVESEDGLGDIRYRSILATINNLYDERGSQAGIQDLVVAATKYNCKILEGVNNMCLPDDSEFADGTGSWGDPHASYPEFAETIPWLGLAETPSSESLYLLNKAVIDQTIKSESISDRNGLMVVSADTSDPNYDPDNATVITCGLGRGYSLGRHQDLEVTEFYPNLHGIKCNPGEVYEFSAYIRKVGSMPGDPDGGPDGTLGIGVIWFNVPKDANYFPPRPASFNVYNDHIMYNSEDATAVALEGTEPDSSLTRYNLSVQAPLSLYGEDRVFAVPYIAFNKANTHYISACMFNTVLNTVQDYAVAVDPYLTLGVSSELLDSSYKLGE